MSKNPIGKKHHSLRFMRGRGRDYDCNDCKFTEVIYKKTYVVEQIVPGAMLTLCRLHLVRYSLKRFKWWLNVWSGYRLEHLGKWWIR